MRVVLRADGGLETTRPESPRGDSGRIVEHSRCCRQPSLRNGVLVRRRYEKHPASLPRSREASRRLLRTWNSPTSGVVTSRACPWASFAYSLLDVGVTFASGRWTTASKMTGVVKELSRMCQVRPLSVTLAPCVVAIASLIRRCVGIFSLARCVFYESFCSP